MKGNGKYLILLFSFVFSISVTVIGWQHSKNQQKIVDNEVLVASEKNNTATDESATEAVNALYYDENHIYLSTSISDSVLDNTSAKVNSLSDGTKKNNLLGNLSDVKKRWELLKATNQLFDMPVISGETINSSVKVKSSTTKDSINSVGTLIQSSGLNDDFTNSLLSVIALANEEMGDLPVELTSSSSQEQSNTSSSFDEGTYTEAKESIDKIVQNGTVVPGFTMDEYKIAKRKIDSLPNGDIKEDYLDKLALVQKRMTEMGLSFE